MLWILSPCSILLFCFFDSSSWCTYLRNMDVLRNLTWRKSSDKDMLMLAGYCQQWPKVWGIVVNVWLLSRIVDLLFQCQWKYYLVNIIFTDTGTRDRPFLTIWYSWSLSAANSNFFLNNFIKVIKNLWNSYDLDDNFRCLEPR
jgi:hypothetical protein